MGDRGSAVAVANPLSSEENRLRRSMLPGLLRSLAWNAERRQGGIRLFEVGNVFLPPGETTGGPGPSGDPDTAGRAAGDPDTAGRAAGSRSRGEEDLPVERETLAAVFAGPGDDAPSAVAAWHALRETLRLTAVEIRVPQDRGRLAGLHPTRSAVLVCRGQVVGTVGEVDSPVAADFGAGSDRVGWLEVDLSLTLDPDVVPRRPDQSRPVSRFPSSDIDLALVTPDSVPVDVVADALAVAGGELLQSVELFDVFRGQSIGEERRSLTFRLRFCSLERTMTDDEVGRLRLACIEAAGALGAVLR
jgi:phenylalanyl-tRNA synthetase beta chain